MKKLLKNRTFIVSIGVGAFIIYSLAIAYSSAMYILDHMSLRQATPTDMAAAMRYDEFWQKYRTNTLIFTGKINSIHDQGDKTSVGIDTSDSYSLTCELHGNTTVQIGNSYKFAAETYQAQREPKGVLLHTCEVI